MAEKDPTDLDIERTEENEEDEALPAPRYEIFSYPADTTLRGYLDQWNADQLYVPRFQRNYVWDQTRASKLIESFLLGLPVPPVFLFKPAGGKEFWIIDGQQRIMSVVNFQKGTFRDNKFRLSGVDKRWLGKSFEELDKPDKFAIETAVLRAVVIQQTDPKDHSSIFHIFERLNTGGIRLNPMEVRQCVSQSKFLDALRDTNEMPAWRALVGLPTPDRRLKDVELLLRAVALFRNLESYEKPMKGFLNSCADELKDDPKKDTKKDREQITKTLQDSITQVYQALGDRPFHLKGRLNYSALDATLVAVMRIGDVRDLAHKFDRLKSDPEFERAVSFNTSDETVLKARMEMAIAEFGSR